MRIAGVSVGSARTFLGWLVVGCAASERGDGGDVDGDPGVTIEYIAHAAFRIQSRAGHRVVIDPYASRVWLGYDWPDGVETAAVLITHPHYDHDAGQSRGHAFPWGDDVAVYRDPGRYEVGDIVIHGIAGKHADPYGMEFGQINTIFVLEVHGVRIAHLGDNGPLTEANYAALGRVDVLIAPADSQYHILREGELETIRDRLKPRWLVPMHYRLPDLESDPAAPRDLGPIEPWLVGRSGVTRVAGHIISLRASDRGGEPEILVFRHSPEVRAPLGAARED